MAWRVIYHPEAQLDCAALGRVEADAALKVITTRIQNGEPDKIGKPLSGRLSVCRRIRTGTTRIIYRVNARAIEVLIIAVGMRRNDEVYIAAQIGRAHV